MLEDDRVGDAQRDRGVAEQVSLPEQLEEAAGDAVPLEAFAVSLRATSSVNPAAIAEELGPGMGWIGPWMATEERLREIGRAHV